jgi:hypothetical protein
MFRSSCSIYMMIRRILEQELFPVLSIAYFFRNINATTHLTSVSGLPYSAIQEAPASNLLYRFMSRSGTAHTIYMRILGQL